MSTSPHLPQVPGTRRVPLRTKVMWGCGGLADNFMFNTMTALGTLVYVNHFKLTPALAGTASNPWYANAPFLYIVVMGSLLATAWKMKVLLVGFQCLGLMLSIVMMWFYPISRERAEETQRRLRAATAT